MEESAGTTRMESAREGAVGARERNLEDEIQPYKIHVSSKYLSLTQKKLELTRLPHEILLPKERAWSLGAPKNEIEPLIDFWLETYSWRNQEAHLNSSLPQYRTAFPLPQPTTSSPTRIHFIHIRSRHRHAIPLLLIPSFPLTNLSLIPLFSPLSDPSSPTSTQPFHLVVPSIPGLGFSDALQTPEAEGNVLEITVGIFNKLMRRLGYEYYIASATGSGRESAAGVDYHLPRLIGEMYPDNCLGVHLLEPEVEAPLVGRETLSWVKFNVAKFFKAAVFGYEKEDWKALALKEKTRKVTTTNRVNEESPLLRRRDKGPGGVGVVGLREPATLSYALCDSPVGLLAVFCSGLRKSSPNHSLSPTEIIDVTSLAWLPGIEAVARFWAAAAREIQGMSKKQKPGSRARVAITVFRVDGSDPDGYTCPAWATRKHNVLFTQRATGLPGLVPWERIDVVVAGVQGLAKQVGDIDPRLRSRRLEDVLVSGSDYNPDDDDEESGHEIQLDVESPDTVVNLNTNQGSRNAA